MVHVFFGTSILLDTIFLLCGEFAKKRQVRRWCYCVEKYGIWLGQQCCRMIAAYEAKCREDGARENAQVIS